MILLIIGWLLVTALLSLVQLVSDNVYYGYPRTYQTNADVGHGGISHFTVENLNGHIFVMELANNDIAKASIYAGPTLSGGSADLNAAIVTFSDANGDGKPDMVLDVANTKYLFFNSNDGKFHQAGG